MTGVTTLTPNVTRRERDEFRGYNVRAESSGGNCVDIQGSSNPFRFFGLVATGCTIGLNMVQTKSEEFH